MNIVSFGGGTNSTAMLIGMYERKIPVDLILFADTGAEMPYTYEYVEIMNRWLKDHDMTEITVVRNLDEDGNRVTLEEHCLHYKNLPSIAYGRKQCSVRFKVSPQDKFCNRYEPFKQIWSNGEKINKYIGYDAGEERRKANAFVYDIQDTKYNKIYALIDWGWYREDCIRKIQEYGLPLPGKSSCFFCPSMKKHEIKKLKKEHPELYSRAIGIERNAKGNLLTIQGLGRNYSWEDFINGVESQVSICGALGELDIACDCYDG